MLCTYTRRPRNPHNSVKFRATSQLTKRRLRVRGNSPRSASLAPGPPAVGNSLPAARALPGPAGVGSPVMPDPLRARAGGRGAWLWAHRARRAGGGSQHPRDGRLTRGLGWGWEEADLALLLAWQGAQKSPSAMTPPPQHWLVSLGPVPAAPGCWVWGRPWRGSAPCPVPESVHLGLGDS